MKCQICKNNPVLWAWQPFGPAENADCFVTPGSHSRGFPVIKICHECYGQLKVGGHITFTHKDTAYAGTIHHIEPLAADEEPKIYPDLASAQEAMDRGETVRIEMYPWEINPVLIQLAQDLQDKERLEEWRECQRQAGEHE